MTLAMWGAVLNCRVEGRSAVINPNSPDKPVNQPPQAGDSTNTANAAVEADQVHRKGFKLTVAYDGAAYAGWQVQVGQRTVQGTLEAAVRKIAGVAARLTASGRTDAGVHALAQVVSFEIPTHLEAPVWRRALNANLPADIRVLDVKHQDGFHALRDAIGKRYRYVIHDADPPNLFHREYSWRHHERLDESMMREGASALLGRHDFSSFEAAGSPRANSIRTIRELCVTRCDFDDGLLWIEVEADGFLYNMVRNIVGALAEVGRRRQSPQWVATLLALCDRTKAAPTAPACGLFLQQVFYEQSDWPHSALGQASSGQASSGQASSQHRRGGREGRLA